MPDLALSLPHFIRTPVCALLNSGRARWHWRRCRIASATGHFLKLMLLSSVLWLEACASFANAHGYAHGIQVMSYANVPVDFVRVRYGNFDLDFKSGFKNTGFRTGQTQKSPVPELMTVNWQMNGVFNQASVPVGSLVGTDRIANWIIKFTDFGFVVIRSEKSSREMGAPRINTEVYTVDIKSGSRLPVFNYQGNDGIPATGCISLRV